MHFLAPGNKHLNVLNARNGDLVHSHSTTHDTEFLLAVSDGVAFLGEWFSGAFVALNTDTGEILWRYPGCESDNCLRVHGSKVYAAMSDGHLHALDADTGELLWRYVPVGGGYVDSAPTVSGDVIYAGSEDNNLYALDASTGELLWHFSADSQIYSSPAVADGLVYVASNHGFIYAIVAER